MDPGLHGRQDTMGLVVHDPRANLTAYGPTVVIRTLDMGETVYSQLVVDLLEEGRTVVRRAAHAEISALHKAMQEGFGFDLEDLTCSDEFILRPLLPEEVIHVGTQPPPVQEMGSQRFHYHPHSRKMATGTLAMVKNHICLPPPGPFFIDATAFLKLPTPAA